MNKVGERIQDELEKMQENQSWLAGEIGCSPAHVSDMIRGNRFPSVDMIVRLERVLGIDGMTLLEDVADTKMEALMQEIEERRNESVRR